MPLPAVVEQHRSGPALRVDLVRLGRLVVEAGEVSRGRIAVLPVRTRQQQRPSVGGGELGQHPQRRRVHHRVRVGGRDIGGVRLVERPVSVPVAALVPRLVHHGVGAGDPHPGTEEDLEGPDDPPVGQVRRERLIVVDRLLEHAHAAGAHAVAPGTGRPFPGLVGGFGGGLSPHNALANPVHFP